MRFKSSNRDNLREIVREMADWKDETVKVYYVYKKSDGRVWAASTDREARDDEYKTLREAFPRVELGRMTKVVKRKDLLKKINQSQIE